ncbi:MAG: PQQ-binding-like beta-propeller repeat protein [Armatimonas sp.]
MSDYPQWRGPKRDGVAEEKNLLKSWPTSGPKLVWQSKMAGYGYGSPSVVGDRLYVIGNEGAADEFLQAIDARSGRPLWKVRLGAVGNPDQQPNFPGARSTPTVDGKSIYALSSAGDLLCIDAPTGKSRWKKSLRKDFGGVPGAWAYAESPLIDGDKLIVTPGGPDATIVALNKTMGEVIWKCKAADGERSAAYSSAVVTELEGVRQYVQFLPKGLVGVDAKTGNVLWRFNGTIDLSYGMNAQTPIVEKGLVYSAAGNRGGTVRLTAAGATQVWVQRNAPCALGGTVLSEGYLYGTNQRELVCVELASGKTAWSNPCVGAASLCLANGLLFLHGENGEVALVDANPKGYTERGRFTPSNRPERLRGPMEKAWAYPVVADGRLYLRDVGTLWVYEIGTRS